ncbi:Mitogen-activated protein kinase 4 [Cytospora mali]|uniref:Mitogen-activated protein kinase 4 n=1 Tax=Cytospora mali TaxID=578113 RepID=A0A194VHT3_CYTMA|nr:Mitogen-activated protein kinase 4 [Valsa mali]
MAKTADLEINTDALTLSELLDIDKQVIQALTFLNTKGVTHGNLNPSTIFIVLRSKDAIVIKIGDLRPTSNPSGLTAISEDHFRTFGHLESSLWSSHLVFPSILEI